MNGIRYKNLQTGSEEEDIFHSNDEKPFLESYMDQFEKIGKLNQDLPNYVSPFQLSKQERTWEAYIKDHGIKRYTVKNVTSKTKFISNLFIPCNIRKPMLRLFLATETGTARRFAFRLKRILHRSFDVKIIFLNDFNEDLLEGTCLFVTSTAGEGAPPDMAKKIAEWLKNQMASVINKDSSPKKFRFGVFALGNSSYKKFCGFGKWLDSSLEIIGGKRLLDIGLGDVLVDREKIFERWSKQALQLSINYAGVAGEDPETTMEMTRWITSTYFLTPEDQPDHNTALQQLSYQHNKTILSSTIVGRKWLCQEAFQTSFILELEVDDPLKKLWYEPGDHVLVFPSNSEKDVNFLMSHITDIPKNFNQLVQLEVVEDNFKWEKALDDLPPSTIQNILRYHVSLLHTPSQDFLLFLSSYTNVDHEKEQLEHLGTDENMYQDWVKDQWTVVDLFRIFPNLKVPSSQLVYRLPQLMPRYYCVASGPRFANENRSFKDRFLKLDLVITILEYKTQTERYKKGVCSDILGHLKIGSKIPIFLASNPNFHWKQNILNPTTTLLIAAGSGIAPFRSFWQDEQYYHNAMKDQRRKRSKAMKDGRSHSMILMFGCRNAKGNILDLDPRELPSCFERASVFSREVSKEYVQDRVIREGQVIFDLISKKNVSVFICGRAAMVNGVHKALIKVINDHGNQNEEIGKAFLQEMKDEGRLFSEIVSNLFI